MRTFHRVKSTSILLTECPLPRLAAPAFPSGFPTALPSTYDTRHQRHYFQAGTTNALMSGPSGAHHWRCRASLYAHFNGLNLIQILRGKRPYDPIHNELYIPLAIREGIAPYAWKNPGTVERVVLDCLEYDEDRRSSVTDISRRLQYDHFRASCDGNAHFLSRKVAPSFTTRDELERQLLQEDDRDLTGEVQVSSLEQSSSSSGILRKAYYKGVCPPCLRFNQLWADSR